MRLDITLMGGGRCEAALDDEIGLCKTCVDVAVASVAMSGNMAQAEAVANSLVRTAGEGSPVAAAAYSTLRGLLENLPQPSIHQDSYTPHGGSVSPST